MKKFYALTLFSFIVLIGYGQQLTQVIRGQVVDQLTQVPVIGAQVIVLDVEPFIGTSADVDGYFTLEGVPIGRVSLKVSSLGYEEVYMNNLELTSGKELILTVQMEEQYEKMEEVVVTAQTDKARAKNDMATVSTRTFSIEESQRFAGGRNDISRMASNFAGVRGANDAVNDIVIRGNSPNGLLWRLEGIDIPNPNHFGDGAATGGPVGMLNNNVLSNSDFFTGAFPAEYGNALSGVFDLSMRNGNYEKHEFLGQIGFNGFEVGLEGPLSRKNHASYLLNYRYSTLGLMSKMGFKFGTGTAIPEYQDGSFKINFPTKKAGKFALFGMGGWNNIAFETDVTDSVSDDNFYASSRENTYQTIYMGVVGASHTYVFNPSTYSKVTVAYNTSNSQAAVDSITPDRSTFPYYRRNYTRSQWVARLLVNKKLSNKHSLRLGGFAKQLQYDLVDSVYEGGWGRFRELVNFNGESWLLQPYAQWQYRLLENVTLNTGLHYVHLTLNNQGSLEPRLGLTWKLNATNRLSLAYGLHGQAAALSVYQKLAWDGQQYVTPNENLKFTKSHHVVLGYDRTLNETMRFKGEIYAQFLYDVIVDGSDDPGSYAMLNASTFSNGPPPFLSNAGTGLNYGLELTLEKFMDKGLYFLSTFSLYRSTYTAGDGNTYSTAFDNGYVMNVLGGKEFVLGKKADAKFRKALVFDLNSTLAGGPRVTPIDLDASVVAGEAVYKEDEAFAEQLSAYFRLDARLGFKLSGKKVSQEWVFDVQNVTNRKNVFIQNYDATTQQIVQVNQLGIFPVFQWKITF